MENTNVVSAPNPHALIGGSVPGVPVSHLDYLAFTLPYKEKHIDDIPYARDFSDQYRSVSPRKGYSRAIEFGIGARMDWHPEVPAQGCGFVYGGKALERCREQKITDQRLVRDMLSVGAKFSRIDAAINTALPDVSAEALAEDFDDGNCETKAKKYTLLRGGGENRGSTFYLGSRTSERMLRVYNKAAQLNLGVSWWRIEEEIKGRHARAFADGFADAGFPENFIRGHIQEFANFPGRKWWVETMLDGDRFEQLVLPRTETNTQKWLMQQVLPALRKLSFNETETLYRFFRAAAHDRGLVRYMELAIAEQLAFRAWEENQGQG